MPVQVKICGLKNQDAVDCAVDAGADYLGFVFYPKSPRNLSVQQSAQLCRHVPRHVKTVAVTVDADNALLDEICQTMQPDYVQLHGKESPERMVELEDRYGKIRCEQSKMLLIKAIPVGAHMEWDSIDRFNTEHVQMLLFDAKAREGELPGGRGATIDWKLFERKAFEDLWRETPWILSGGLNVDNVGEALSQTGARIVDVSSGVESS
ncbi:MAG: phosphoribosylanthranilate isomerase, partial [Alphaproteobacteria bacterium]